MKFIKAQTNGNDFVIIEAPSSEFALEKRRLIADRKFGIGADQLIFLNRIRDQYYLEFFNQDGAWANMCGNGSCAVAKYIFQKYNENHLTFTVSNTLYHSEILNEKVSISFSKPLTTGDIISTGNKHYITDISNVDDVLRISKKYPECNIHFIELIDQQTIKIKTYERGVGWTLACGSGAIAVGFYSKLKGKIKIIQDGGESLVEVFSDSIKLTTSPKIVFEGEFYE